MFLQHANADAGVINETRSAREER